MKDRLLLLAAVCGGLFAAPLLGQPTFVTQPTNQSVSVGANVQFRVTVAPGTPNLQFQWWFKDAALEAALNPSATGNILRLTNVTEAMTGDYWAVATDDNGSTSSDKARLNLDPTFVKVTSSPALQGDQDLYNPYWVDLNGDGFLDLVVTGGFWTEGGKPVFVFVNNGDGTFTRDTTSDLAKAVGRWTTFGWGDFDNDGDLDALGGQWEATSCVYFRNDGKGRFAKVLANRNWTVNQMDVRGSSVTCADYDNDGWLDILAGYWGNRAAGIWGTNSVLHNVGDGRFELDCQSALAVTRTWTELWGWADFDGDGDQDLFGATSWDTDQRDLFFENLGGGKFAPITVGPLVETPDVAIGPAWGDYDNDGDWDILVTRFNQTDLLYRNDGNGVFAVDPNGPKRLGNDQPEVPAWADYDNDGHLDLFILQYNAPGRMFRNRGDGTLEEVFVGSPTQEARGYGATWGDYDNDGFMDLVCVNGGNAVNYLYRNNLTATGNQNHWLKVRLQGTASNRDGNGATVRVKATIGGKSVWQMRQIVSQGHDLQLLAHFGLGDATKAELIRIEWPSGNVQELTDYDANSLYTITEPNRIQPLRPSASPGGAVVLTASVAASYQWRFNGVDLPGETKRTLSLTNITVAMAGRYSVVVTAADGTPATHFTYLNVDPTFTKIITDPVVTDPVTNQKPAASWGAAWGDYDNDGFIDLAMGCGIPGEGTTGTAVSNKLYRNGGDGTFQPVTDSVISAGSGYSGGCGWADADNDGYLDLYIGEWSAWYSSAQPSHPYFFRNLGNGSFGASDAIPSPIGRETPSLPVWGDWNNDGWVDLFVVSAWNSFRATNSLYLNLGASGFTRVWDNPVGNSTGDAQWAVWSDYDNDGLLDLLVSYLHNPARLYHNDGGGAFSRVAASVIYQETSSAGAAWR